MCATTGFTIASVSCGRIQWVPSSVTFWSNIHLLVPESQGQCARNLSTVVVVLMISLRKVFDFTMCNPPFYSSKEDVQRSAEAKEYQPNAVCYEGPVSVR